MKCKQQQKVNRRNFIERHHWGASESESEEEGTAADTWAAVAAAAAAIRALSLLEHCAPLRTWPSW